MTDRAEQTRHLFRVLADEIGKAAPPGLGHWPRAWEIVEAPSKRLLDLAAAYERRRANREDVIRAAKAVRAAWREAATAWEEAGRPGLDRGRPAPDERHCPRCGGYLREDAGAGDRCRLCERELEAAERTTHEEAVR